MRLLFSLVIAGTPLVSACEAETVEAWGGIHVTANRDGLGGYAGAWIVPGSPPENLPKPGECKVAVGAPGRTYVGPMVLRISDELEQTMPEGPDSQYYLGIDFAVRLEPGMRIEAEAEGNATYPPFAVETRFPPFIEGAMIPGEEGAVLSRDEPMRVTWKPAGGDYLIGFSVDHPESGTAVGCVANDADGAITIPAELLQVHYTGVDIHLRLVRNSVAFVDVKGLEQVSLRASHVVGHNVTFSP